MIDPIAFTIPALNLGAFSIGPFSVYWYALAYVAGFIGGWAYINMLIKPFAGRPNKADIEEYVTWVILGVILGGRLGYVAFYNPGLFLSDPIEILYIWEGGMSFHGGLIGVIVTLLAFSYRKDLSPYRLADLSACAAPIGLFLGRIANFVNGELWGRPSDVPWAMIFPADPLQLPRHPSQFYEAGLEGLVLFCILAWLWHRTDFRDRPGMITGCFLTGYGLARMIAEIFREPDMQLGFVIGDHVTMGQLLSLPMILLGLWLMRRALRRPRIPLSRIADGGEAA